MLFGGKPSKLQRLLRRFCRDRSGNYIMITAICAPVLIGVAGLGTENGVWLYTHQSAQSAADAAAFSGAQTYSVATNPSSGTSDATAAAKAIAANYGFVDGQHDASVTAAIPPTKGKLAGKTNAIEVIVQQKQDRLFSALWNKNKVVIKARAVAQAGTGGMGCVLALDPSASGAATATGSTSVNLTNCDLYDDSADSGALSGGGASQVNARLVGVVGGATGQSHFTTTMGLFTGIPAVSDPYADVTVPSFSGCDQNNFSAKKTVTIDPGVYCKGMTFNAQANVTFNPGIYYVAGGTFTVNGGASLQGTGVTIVLTTNGSGYADLKFNGSGSINFVAPASGALAGIVLFGDRSAPLGTSYKINGDSGQAWGGAVYLPRGAVEWSGNNSTTAKCTQIIADTITFTGNSSVSINCQGFGTRPIGLATKLAE